MDFKVAEKFVSINGEGLLCGQLAVFIRFAGCNLDCSYCDTAWANKKNVSFELMNEKDIYDYIKSTKVKNITLTGGEPLLQDGITELLKLISKDDMLRVEIETNGSIALEAFCKIKGFSRFTMDYKLPSSNMETKMLTENFQYLTDKDTLKFVAGSMEDLEKTKYIIEKFKLSGKTNLYISPVFGEITMDNIVDFMKDNNMNGVTLQMQLHKVIWEPSKRGV